MTEYFNKYKTLGIRALAERANTKPSYLLQLVYSPTKVPSLPMALRLVRGSDRKLTFEGLAREPEEVEREA